jgi:hypothetical protein
MGSFNVHASLHPRGKDTCICTSVARSSRTISSSRCIHELLHIFHRKKKLRRSKSGDQPGHLETSLKQFVMSLAPRGGGPSCKYQIWHHISQPSVPTLCSRKKHTSLERDFAIFWLCKFT